MPTSSASNSPAWCSARRARRRAAGGGGSLRLWRRPRLPRRRSRPRRLPQRALHQGADRPRQRATSRKSCCSAPPTLGRDLAGSVATTLLTGLTADCTELDVDADKSLAATRPTFGGSLLCTIYTLNYPPADGDRAPARDADAGARTEGASRPHRQPSLSTSSKQTSSPRCCRFLPDRDSDKSNLAFADVVVAGGLGLQSAGKFPAGAPARRRARRRIRLLAPAGAEGLGRRPTGRSARPARPSGRSSTSPPAFPARSSIASASRAPT